MERKDTPHIHGVAWHATPAEKVLKRFHTTPDGLSEADISDYQKKYGKNFFKEKKQKTIFHSLVEQFKSSIALVLLGAFVVTLALQEFVDATVILIALMIAVVLGVVQEGRASRAFKKLSESQTHSATVVRDGKKRVVSSEELVPGDIIELESGAQVPADLRLFEAKKLTVNEASLTGEWLPVKKDIAPVPIGAAFSDKENMAWMGTLVVDGYARGVVVATGVKTAIGEIAEDVQHVEEGQTPLQKETAYISRIMLVIILFLVTLIFVLGLVRGQGFEEMFLTAVAVAVASVPEGLPAAVTIILAIAMESLLRKGGLVRNLLAAETLGSTSIILTDKTGTLTQARMAIVNVISSEKMYVRHEKDGWGGDQFVSDIFNTSLCATEAFIERKEGGDESSFVVRGEPMEKAIVEEMYYAGISTEGENMRTRRIDYLAFNSDNRFAAGITKEGGKMCVCMNGAPELLLEEATHVHTSKGVKEMTQKVRDHFNEMIEERTSHGERLIAVAYKETKNESLLDTETPEEIVHKNIFMGLLVFHDPIREDVPRAIKEIQKAGVRVVLVTGDNARTALSVAQSVGIAREGDQTFEGKHIEKMDDSALLRSLQNVPVFARVLPRQKMRIAEVLQNAGEIVAMSGDGVNDAPALRKAHIGIAVGSGTEVAKESSDLILVSDSFSIMRDAIEEGRRVFSNLRKIIGYLFATSLSEVALIGTALAASAPVPILPAQILWANVIEEGLMSVAFAFEKGERKIMLQKPQDMRNHGLLSREMLMFTGIAAFSMSTLLLILYFYLRSLNISVEELRSVMFLAVSIDSLFIAFSFRSLTEPVWNVPLKNNIFFIIAFFISFGLLLLVLTIPFFQFLLSYTPLPALDIFLVALFGFTTLITIEVLKWFFFERFLRA